MALITVNGQVHRIDKDVLSYEDILELAGYDPKRIISVTWRQSRPGTGQGILAPGEHVTPIDNVIFNAYHTGSA